MVFQNDVLFKDSLLNNIDMGRKLDMDAIDRAVEVAQAASFIAGSGGYEKPIAVKGVNLSGGQKQRSSLPGPCRQTGISDPGRLLQRPGL